MRRVEQKIQKIANHLIKAEVDWVSREEYPKPPREWGSDWHETELGFGRGKYPESGEIRSVEQVTKSFMEGNVKAATDYIDQLLTAPIGEGHIGYKALLQRNSYLLKRNSDYIDIRLDTKSTTRRIRQILEEIDSGFSSENDIVGAPLNKLVKDSDDTTIVKGVDHLKAIRQELIQKIDQLKSEEESRFDEADKGKELEKRKSAKIRDLFHRSLFVKPIGFLSQALAYPSTEESKKFIERVGYGIQWASRIIDWKKTDSVVSIGKTKEIGRFSYQPHSAMIKLDETCDDGAYVHELGHHIEIMTPGIKYMAKKFYDKRTAGYPLVKMQELVPWGNYRDDEYGRDDRFINKYTGKDYEDGATEIVSMGLEHLFRDPVEFRLKDPEHFEFTMQCLRSVRHREV